MKILLIHTYYNIRGGEDQVFEQEYQLLSSKYDVRKISFQNEDKINGLFQFFQLYNNSSSNKIVADCIKEFTPDVVHIHNLHFTGGFGIINTVSKFNIPIVITLHNYRLLCPSGTLYDGKSIFLESYKSNFPWKAIISKVYKQSSLLTFWVALAVNKANKKGVLNQVSKYLVLTNFARELYEKSNLNIDRSKFIIKSNFVNSDYKDISCKRDSSFLFVGRLSKEKGIDFLLDTIINLDVLIKLAGDGPLLQQVLEFQSVYPGKVKYLGKLSREEILREMSKSTALLFPSVWYEGMPMTIIEAFSMRLPVIANNLGAMSSMIVHGENGLLYDGTKGGFKGKIQQWIALSKYEKEQMRDNAYQSYRSNYTSDVNLKMLEHIYRGLINE